MHATVQCLLERYVCSSETCETKPFIQGGQGGNKVLHVLIQFGNNRANNCVECIWCSTAI